MGGVLVIFSIHMYMCVEVGIICSSLFSYPVGSGDGIYVDKGLPNQPFAHSSRLAGPLFCFLSEDLNTFPRLTLTCNPLSSGS